MPGEQKDARNSLSEGFSPPGRVRGREMVDAVFKLGKRIHGRNVIIIFRTRSDDLSYCSVFVPKKAGNPVRRNRARRILKEYIRISLKKHLAGKDVIVLLKAKASDENARAATSELDVLLPRLSNR